MSIKKVQNNSIDVIDFNAKHVSTGQVGAYIKKLYTEENFLHIGYRFEKNKNGSSRFVLYTLPSEEEIIQYFKDRCPGMIENECRCLESIEHEFFTWKDGFSEVKPDLK